MPPAKPITASDVPPDIRDQIIREHVAARMRAIGSRSTPAKRAASAANLAAVNATRSKLAKRRLAAVRRDLDRGLSLTAACREHGVNYARAKLALGL